MNQYDTMEGYCRMLGHYLSFQYCRTQQHGIPCPKILDCYFERIPIQDYVDEHYSQEEQQQIFAEKTPKLNTIFDIMQKVQQRSTDR